MNELIEKKRKKLNDEDFKQFLKKEISNISESLGVFQREGYHKDDYMIVGLLLNDLDLLQSILK